MSTGQQYLAEGVRRLMIALISAGQEHLRKESDNYGTDRLNATGQPSDRTILEYGSHEYRSTIFDRRDRLTMDQITDRPHDTTATSTSQDCLERGIG
jgi:hypothetical protein